MGSIPEVPIAYIALSPSPSRWNEHEAGDKLNSLIEGYTKTQKNLLFVDESKISLAANGKPRSELFVADQLHFNEKGYKLLPPQI